MEQPGTLPKITIWQQQRNIDRKIVVCVCECRVAPVNVDVYVRCGVLAAMVTLEVKTCRYMYNHHYTDSFAEFQFINLLLFTPPHQQQHHYHHHHHKHIERSHTLLLLMSSQEIFCVMPREQQCIHNVIPKNARRGDAEKIYL